LDHRSADFILALCSSCSFSKISLSDPGPFSIQTPAKSGTAVTDEEKLTIKIRTTELKAAGFDKSVPPSQTSLIVKRLNLEPSDSRKMA